MKKYAMLINRKLLLKTNIIVYTREQHRLKTKKKLIRRLDQSDVDFFSFHGFYAVSVSSDMECELITVIK